MRPGLHFPYQQRSASLKQGKYFTVSASRRWDLPYSKFGPGSLFPRPAAECSLETSQHFALSAGRRRDLPYSRCGPGSHFPYQQPRARLKQGQHFAVIAGRRRDLPYMRPRFRFPRPAAECSPNTRGGLCEKPAYYRPAFHSRDNNENKCSS